MKLLILLLFFTQWGCYGTENEDIFVATNDWQDIKENQKVPSGLHYRMNLETGKKEAKILVEDTKNDENTAAILSDANPKEGILTILIW
jgi:hypothetical protein